MANLTGADLETLLLRDLQANVTTDPPLSTAATASVTTSDTYALLNDAAVQVYEAWGGTIKAATSATLWTPAQSSGTTGKATGILTGISEILRVWSTATSGSTGASGDNELHRVDLAEIEALRSDGVGLGTYILPQVYAVSMMQTATAADVGKLLLDYWPGVTGLYFPAHYIPHLGSLAATTDVYDLPDIAQRDVAHLAAFYGAERIARQDLMGSIMANVSDKTRLFLERRQTALTDARQDDANR